MRIKDRLKEYLDKIGMYPDSYGKYRCISGTHEDNHSSMSLHPSGTYLHCFSCNESFNIYGVAARRLGVPCDKAHFSRIAREVETVLNIPSEWRPSADERRAYYRKNRDITGRQTGPLSKSAVFRDGLLREMAEAVDYGDTERALICAELLFALFLLPEDAGGGKKELSREEKERLRMAEGLARK